MAFRQNDHWQIPGLGVAGLGGVEMGVAVWDIACVAAKNSLPCFLRQNWYRNGKNIEETRPETRVGWESRLLEG